MLIAFKLKLLLACAAGLAGPIAVAPLVAEIGTHGAATEPAIVRVAPGSLSYREAGEFTRAGRQAEAPLRTVRLERPLHIMRQQVSSSDYQICVQEGACRALDRGVAIASNRPAVQVSWHDAEAYAGWLSRKTGHSYRLPSDAEWAFAAGSRFRDDGLPVDAADPSKRWIGRYERESERDLSDTTAYPFGKFGLNEHGVSPRHSSAVTCFRAGAYARCPPASCATTPCRITTGRSGRTTTGSSPLASPGTGLTI